MSENHIQPPSQDLLTFDRVLTISNPIIRTALIVSYHIDQLVVFSDMDRAYSYHKANGFRYPRNVQAIYDDQARKAGSKKGNSWEHKDVYKGTPRIVANQETAKRDIQTKLQRLEQDIVRYEGELRRIEQDIRNNTSVVNQTAGILTKNRNDMNAARDKLSKEMRKLKENNETADIASREQEIVETVEKVREMELQLGDAVVAGKRLDEELKAIKDDLTEARALMKPLQDAQSNRLEELEKLETQAANQANKVTRYTEKRRTLSEKVADLERQLQEERALLTELIHRAETACPRVEVGPKENIETLQEELRKKEENFAARQRAYVFSD
jgi:chromosome segregation ATPase